jgi:hypothetical protein
VNPKLDQYESTDTSSQKALFDLVMNSETEPHLGKSPTVLTDRRRAKGLTVAWIVGINTSASTFESFEDELRVREKAVEGATGPLSDPDLRATARQRLALVRAAGAVADTQAPTWASDIWFGATSNARKLIAARQREVVAITSGLHAGLTLGHIRTGNPLLGAALSRAGQRWNTGALRMIRAVSDAELRSRHADGAPCIHCGDRDCHVHCTLVRGALHEPVEEFGAHGCRRCGRATSTTMHGQPVWWHHSDGVATWLAERTPRRSLVEELMEELEP